MQASSKPLHQKYLRAVVLVSGKVQGVGYRYWTREEARAMQLVGSVRNMSDGRVEAHISGDEPSVERLIELMRMGPPHARVENIEVEREYTDISAINLYGSFDIER
jgi:acylphosphatase